MFARYPSFTSHFATEFRAEPGRTRRQRDAENPQLPRRCLPGSPCVCVDANRTVCTVSSASPDHPPVRPGNHVNKPCEGIFVPIVQVRSLLRGQESAAHSQLDPGLCLGNLSLRIIQLAGAQQKGDILLFRHLPLPSHGICIDAPCSNTTGDHDWESCARPIRPAARVAMAIHLRRPDASGYLLSAFAGSVQLTCLPAMPQSPPVSVRTVAHRAW